MRRGGGKLQYWFLQQSGSDFRRGPGNAKGHVSVKRSCLILCSSAATVLALALPGVGLADSSTDGWSWTGTDGWSWTGESTTPAPDGWSWGGGEAATADPAPAPDGWSWGGDSPEAAPTSAG